MPDMSYSNTVVVACSRADSSQRIVEALSDQGFSVVGPVASAAMALALAAQSPLTMAVVEHDIAGDGHDLARRLMDNWGVPSVVFDEPLDPGAQDQAWRAGGEMAARVRRALSIASAPPQAV